MSGTQVGANFVCYACELADRTSKDAISRQGREKIRAAMKKIENKGTIDPRENRLLLL